MKHSQTKNAEAKKRKEVYDSLTIQEKIDKLDSKFGKGLGAVKERLKLSLKVVQDTAKNEIKEFQKLRERVAYEGKIPKVINLRTKQNYQKPKINNK